MRQHFLQIQRAKALQSIECSWKFAELRRLSAWLVAGCSLTSSDGSLRVIFNNSFEDASNSCFVIKSKSAQKKVLKLKRKAGALWAQGSELGKIDGISLLCDSQMIDCAGWAQRFGAAGRLPGLAECVVSGAMQKAAWWLGSRALAALLLHHLECKRVALLLEA